MARDQRRVRRAAGHAAGDALQSDRNVLQPDAAVLDWRRRGAAVAGGSRRRRMARSDLFHLRRPRHRPDRAGDYRRREPALELQSNQRPAWPVGASGRRFCRAGRRRGLSRARQTAMALAEALVGDASLLRLFRDCKPGDIQQKARAGDCDANRCSFTSSPSLSPGAWCSRSPRRCCSDRSFSWCRR